MSSVEIKDLFEQKINKLINDKGYMISKKICNTSQGSIFYAKNSKSKSNKNKIVIKITSKLLHSKSLTHMHSKSGHIKTTKNIINEAQISKYLSNKNYPKGKYIVYTI